MMRQLFVFVTILVLLAACTSATEMPTAAPATETPTSVPPTLTPMSCQPSEILDTQVAFGEIQGDMQSDGELWALLFFKTAQAKADGHDRGARQASPAQVSACGNRQGGARLPASHRSEAPPVSLEGEHDACPSAGPDRNFQIDAVPDRARLG